MKKFVFVLALVVTSQVSSCEAWFQQMDGAFVHSGASGTNCPFNVCNQDK